MNCAASRAARMRAISATTSSGVLRRLARLCAWLADSGTSIRSAPLSSARSAPFRFGTSTDANRSGSVFAKATSSAVSASWGRRRAGTNEPTSISRWPAAHASRIHSSFWAVGRTRAMLWRPSRRPTSRMITGGKTLMGVSLGNPERAVSGILEGRACAPSQRLPPDAVGRKQPVTNCSLQPLAALRVSAKRSLRLLRTAITTAANPRLHDPGGDGE